MQKLKLPLRRIKRRVLLEVNQPTKFGKTDIIHLISKRLHLVNYLELCTSSTGNYYSEIERTRFRTARRLMYNCPNNFSDGHPIDFRIADFDIGAAVHELKADGNKVDICLVDGWHTYDCAIRDLTGAYELLADGGVLVVHDCLPLMESLVSPVWIRGQWSGVSYRAYLDFVLARSDLDYCTINVDYGCGIIFKNRAIDILRDANSPIINSKLIADWFAVHNNDHVAFRFFLQNYTQLLRLISAKAFVHQLVRKRVRRL
jgi:Methyltransferase domain